MSKTSLNDILHVNKYWCIGSSVAIAQFHLYFLSTQITHNNILLLLCEMHNTLHLSVLLLLILIFLSALSEILANSEQKKYFIDNRTVNAIQLLVPIKKNFLGSLLFQNKSQQRGIPQGLLDKYSLFIGISLNWTLSSGQKPIYLSKS